MGTEAQRRIHIYTRICTGEYGCYWTRYASILYSLCQPACPPPTPLSTRMSRFSYLAALLLVAPSLSLAWYTANTTLTLAQVVGDPQCASNETAFHALNEIHIEVSERRERHERQRDHAIEPGQYDTLTPMLMDLRV